MRDWFSRWQTLRDASRNVLSMNQRNLGYVYPHNARHDFPIANDKLLSKEILSSHAVPVAKTHFSYRYFYELHDLASDLRSVDDFVIKPANGSAGNGILVIVGHEGDEWIGINGKRYSIADLRRHIADIIFGVYSHDKQDAAIIEQRIVQHPVIDRLFDKGLADVRLILFRHELILTMSRVPTMLSAGKANLHQGAVGVGLDPESGRSYRAMFKQETIFRHPDTDANLIGVQIPFWEEILDHSHRLAEVVPLKYVGIDVAISEKGPVVLEINARPGLDIQNVTACGMRPILEALR